MPNPPLSPRRAPPAPNLGVGFASGACVKRPISTLSAIWVVCCFMGSKPGACPTGWPCLCSCDFFCKSLQKSYYQKYAILSSKAYRYYAIINRLYVLITMQALHAQISLEKIPFQLNEASNTTVLLLKSTRSNLIHIIHS